MKAFVQAFAFDVVRAEPNAYVAEPVAGSWTLQNAAERLSQPDPWKDFSSSRQRLSASPRGVERSGQRPAEKSTKKTAP